MFRFCWMSLLCKSADIYFVVVGFVQYYLNGYVVDLLCVDSLTADNISKGNDFMCFNVDYFS